MKIPTTSIGIVGWLLVGWAVIAATSTGSAQTVLTTEVSGLTREMTAEAVKTVRVVLPDGNDPVMQNMVSVFTRQVQARCGAKVIIQGDAPLTIMLAIEAGFGAEGFRIIGGKTGTIRIVGNDKRGVLHGIGKFLRTSRYEADGFTPGSWRGESVPLKPVRGIYFATHFHNYYHNAPIEEIQRYVEDLALWGYNELVVWNDLHHFNGFDDPEAVAHRARLRAILLAAKQIGMDVSMAVLGNDAYANSPPAIRANPKGGRGGYYPCSVCPSTPEGMLYILKIIGEELDWAADLKLRSIWIWPYDQGGCGCEACKPWGSNGFMKCVVEQGKLIRKKMPGTKIVLSTWYMDANEWSGVQAKLKANKGLADVILNEPGSAGVKIDPQDLGLPLIGFPEISMDNTFPWGGFGATPLTAKARKKWSAVKSTHAGGIPYSEGIFEDLTKVVYSQLYWNDRSPEETVREYIAYEFSPDVVDDMVKVIETLERNHHWRWWPGKLEGVKLQLNWFPSRGAKPQADPGAEEAYATVKKVDAGLPDWARKSWRWRIVYLRALLDAELKANGGAPNQRCNDAFAELMEIYHTDKNSDPVVRPPLPEVRDATLK